MQGKLIILIGIPGSGKSTYAAQYVQSNSNAIVVGRDKLRELLFGYTESTVGDYYKHEQIRDRESMVTEFQHLAIDKGLQQGKTVIIDDTNCNLDRLKKLYDKYVSRVASITIQLFDTPIGDCLNRNAMRTRQVPDECVLKFYEGFAEIKFLWESKGLDMFRPTISEMLDEKGFVFLDAQNKPFLIRMWEGTPWIFYWHVDKHWVSLRQVNQMEIWVAVKEKLPDEQAEMYHNLHERPF